MNFIYRDKINEDFDMSMLDDEDDFAFEGPDEDDEIAYINGKFYYNDGSGDLVPVPQHLQSRYLQEYENWQLEQELAAEDNYDREASLEAEKQRKEKNKNSLSSADGIGKKILDTEQRKAMFKGSNVEKHTKYNTSGAKKYTNPDFKFMEQQIMTLINNMLADEYISDTTREIRKGYAPQDHYASEVTGPDIALKARNRHHKKSLKLKEKEIPYVLFYFDQSGSFTGYGTGWKTQKGKEVRAIFKKYEDGSPEEGIEPGQLKVITRYFGSWVSDSPYDTGGGNTADIIQPDIREIAGNRPVNVVIITDRDLNYETETIAVQGNVWYMFFENEAPTLPSHIYGVGKNMGQNIEYFFTR